MQKPPRCAPAEKKRSRSTCGSVPKNPRRFRPKTGAAFCCRTARKSPPPPGNFPHKTKKVRFCGLSFKSALRCSCGRLAPRRNRPAVRPPKKAQPLNLRRRSEKSPPLSPENGGGVLLPHRKKKPAPAGELLPQLSPETKKRAALGAPLTIVAKITFF